MTNLLIKTFVKDYENTKNMVVRQGYGRLGSLVGIVVNLLLFAGKFTVGTLFGSVAITADGVNNLSDAGSSVVSLISFRLAGKPADREHPYGHARIEYLAAMIVACLILVLGVELGKSSFEKILNPEAITFSMLMVGVLVFSIGAKLWLFFFNRNLGKRIDSEVMRATAADSLSDVMATTAVLISTLLSPILGYPLDGWMGVAVSAFILLSGINIIRDAMNKLLGDAPTQELVESIERFVVAYDGILGVHDLMVHSYGPGRCFASLHAEVSSREDILKSHDLIDNIERDILRREGVHLVLHLDPIVTDNAEMSAMREQVTQLLHSIDPGLTMHDFRAVLGETHNNLIFDVVVPYTLKQSNLELQDRIDIGLSERLPGCYGVITFDRTYTSGQKHE
ncbi:MAG: cation diffusion facilitator family transporter [Angelakisella sp.]